MTVLVDLIVLLLHVELAEEVERDHRVDVHDDRQQHHRQHQLETIMIRVSTIDIIVKLCPININSPCKNMSVWRRI